VCAAVQKKTKGVRKVAVSLLKFIQTAPPPVAMSACVIVFFNGITETLICMMRNIIVCVEGGKKRGFVCVTRDRKHKRAFVLYWTEYKNTSSVKNNPSGGGGGSGRLQVYFCVCVFVAID